MRASGGTAGAGAGLAATGAAAGCAGVAAAAPAAGAGVAAAAGSSPSSRAMSASVSGARWLRWRRACSAAMEDLLHLKPPFSSSAAAGLGAAAEAATGAAAAGVAEGAGAAGAGGAAAAGASPRSHDMGCPAFSASTSSSLISGRPERLRKACSAAITELFSGLRGQAGKRPSSPPATALDPSSAILVHPFATARQAWAANAGSFLEAGSTHSITNWESAAMKAGESFRPAVISKRGMPTLAASSRPS